MTVDEIDVFLQDLGDLTDRSDICSSDDDESEIRIERRNLRRRLIPFYQTRKDFLTYFSEEQLIKTFQFDRPSLENITVQLLPKRKTQAKRNLLPLDMVLIALQFYATGTFQTVVGNVFRYSHSSNSCSINAVSLALSMISIQHIYFLDNLTMLKNDFAEIAHIPGIIGCLDGTHVRQQRPTLFEKAYVNRKNYHSINVQGICDADNRFLNVHATKPGSCHDCSIFNGSAVGKKFEAGHFGSGFLLGDSVVTPKHLFCLSHSPTQ